MKKKAEDIEILLHVMPIALLLLAITFFVVRYLLKKKVRPIPFVLILNALFFSFTSVLMGIYELLDTNNIFLKFNGHHVDMLILMFAIIFTQFLAVYTGLSVAFIAFILLRNWIRARAAN
jgi:hypothetical protein